MILQLVIGETEKKKAQTQFRKSLEDQLGYWSKETIGYQGGNGIYNVYSRGPQTLYYAYSPPRDEDKTPRHWNSFGIYGDHGIEGIGVEINIPSRFNSGRVAGFFARDPITGVTYVLHDGGIGGGRKGIGKDSLLAWLGEELVLATNGKEVREGLVVAQLGSPHLSAQIWRFVQRIDRFKHAVANGLLDTSAFKETIRNYAEYRKEFSGMKSGKRNALFAYQTHHGAVVDALYEERNAAKKAGETVGNTPLVDLHVIVDGKLAELVEVKCSTERQTLYTAIGQLVTHSANERQVVRTLVLPEDGTIPSDIQLAIDRLGIGLRRFRLTGPADKRGVVLL